MALALLLLLQCVDQMGMLPNGVHFRLRSTSDFLMQTLPIAQLRKTPFQTLWYLHKQPPMLDAIRAGVAQFFRGSSDVSLAYFVDGVLFSIWAAFFAGIASLVFIWVRRLCCDSFAFVASLIWILHPAPIFYARFLDGTLISSFGVLWFFYELWRLKRSDGSITRLAFAVVFLFYIRTIFQWYFFLIMFIVLLLMNISKRQLTIFIGISGLMVIPFLLKQHILFDTLSSSTFTGYHKCGVIWYRLSHKESSQLRSEVAFNYPPEADLYSGNDSHNTRQAYEDNLVYTRAFNRQLLRNPLGCLYKMAISINMNSKEFFGPSSLFGRGAIVRHFFWTKFYNFIFSGYRYVCLLISSCAIWLYYNRKTGHSQHTRDVEVIFIPFLYILCMILLGNRYGWSESSRLKFLLEPLLYILISSSFYRLFKKKNT